MKFDIFFLSTLISALFLLVIIELIRKQRLKEQYSILWIAVSIVMIAFSLRRELLEELAEVLKVSYPPAILFLLGLLFSFVLIMHFSVIISRLSNQHTRAIQEIGLLKKRIEDIEKRQEKLK